MSNQVPQDWLAFGEKLIKERKEAPRSSLASATFVKRMTSSAADPEAAQEEGDAGAPPPAREK